MDLSTNSEISPVIIIEIEPLNVSDELKKASEFEVDIWNNCITNEFPISEIENIDNKNVILHIGSPHQGSTIKTKIVVGE